MEDKVSVCMVTYNRNNTLLNTIDNVMSQSFYNTNLVIVDGMSSDNSVELITKLRERSDRMKWYGGETGYVYNHNKALKYADGDFICWQDSDDYSSPNRIEAQINYLKEHPDVDVVGCTTLFNENIAIANTLNEMDHKTIVKLLKKYPINQVIHFQSVMFRKSVLEKFTNKKYFYDEFDSGKCGEGFLYTLLFLGYKFANINNCGYLYTMGSQDNSMSKTINPEYALNLSNKSFTEKKKIILDLFTKYNTETKESEIVKPKAKRGRPKKNINKVEES